MTEQDKRAAAEPPLDCRVGRDIVKRLRKDADINADYTLTCDDVIEAANENERLREALKPFATIDLLECRLPPEFAMHVLRARGALTPNPSLSGPLRWRDVAEELPQEAQEVLFVRGGKTLHGAWIGGIFWHSNQRNLLAEKDAEIERLRDLADEYNRLMRHMDAGGDFFAFQVAEAGRRNASVPNAIELTGARRASERGTSDVE